MPSLSSYQKIWTALKCNPSTGIFSEVILAREQAENKMTVVNQKGWAIHTFKILLALSMIVFEGKKEGLRRPVFL